MSSVSAEAFEEKKDKIKRNVLEDLEYFYSDPEEWHLVSGSFVKYASFYSNCLNQLIKAAVLYGYDASEFVGRFLAKGKDFDLSSSVNKSHQYLILRKFKFSQVVAGLICGEKVNLNSLEESSNFYHVYLRENGYSNEQELFDELNADTILPLMFPQILINVLSNERRDYSRLFSFCENKDDIWACACGMALGLIECKLEKAEGFWLRLCTKWREGLVVGNFSAFDNTYLILLYHAICSARGTEFSIRGLASDINKIELSRPLSRRH